MSSLLEQHFQQHLRQTGWLFLLNFVCVGLLFAMPCQPLAAQSTTKKPTGSSHRSYRAAGIKAIPTIDADPEYFRLLVRKPELIVSIWQLMGVTQMSTERTGPYSVKTNDGAGTISDLELIYGNDRLHVFYGNGSYTGPLLKQKLSGRCVITIQPLVGTTADHNFSESLKFVQRLNQSTRANGPGVKGMGRKLKIEQRTVQKVAVRAPRVQVAKPQVVSPSKQNRSQPVVSPSMIGPSAPVAINSRRRFVQASATPAPVQQKLADVNARPGVSVLVGGPRSSSQPVVSVADQSDPVKPQR